MPETMIFDLDAAKTGAVELNPATVENAIASLERFGAVLLKNAIPTEEISGLLETAIAHGHKVEATARAKEDQVFDPSFGFVPSALACHLTALDPATAGRHDLAATTLWQAAMKSPILHPVLVAAIGHEASWAMARVRVVIPGVESGNVDGKLPLHLEKGAFKYPGIHNIWTPLTAPDVVSNGNAPGLQFYFGRLDYTQNMTPENEAEVYSWIGTLGSRVNQSNPEPDEHGFFFRPEMTAGDVAIFSGSVPHAGYIPPGAEITRVGCDIRVFPRTDMTGTGQLTI